MRIVLITVALILVSSVAGATVFVPVELSELSRDAVAIARGRVVAVDAQWTDGRRGIETIVSLETETYLKGSLGDVVQFRVPGGSLGRFRNIVVGAPQFTVGQQVIVFLGSRGPTVPYVLGMSQGVFRLVQSQGDWMVTPPPIVATTRWPHRERHFATVATRRIRTPGPRAGRNGTMIPDRALRRWCGLMVAMAMLLGHARPALAYLKFGSEANGREVTLKWTTTPVRYFVTNQGVSGVSATDFQAAVAQAFATWQAVPSASITYQFAGFTANLPGDDDGISTLGFRNEPTMDCVLASTSFLVDDATGALLESDIFFNSAFSWSVAKDGERAKWDIESIALHEIGHFSGLGHSAIGETELMGGSRRVLSTGAVMFPIALGAGDIVRPPSRRRRHRRHFGPLSGQPVQPDDRKHLGTGHQKWPRRVWRSRGGVRSWKRRSDRELHADARRAVFHCRTASRSSRHSSRATRRRGHRQFLRFVGASRPDLPRGVFRSAGGRAHGAATAAPSKSRSPHEISVRSCPPSGGPVSAGPSRFALSLLLMPAIVSAQTSKRRTELGGDLRWLAGIHFEDVNANETGFGGVTRTVFRSATSFDQVACPEVKVIVGLTRALDFEGGLAYGRTHLTTRITQDPEASNVTIAEQVSAYVLEAGVAAHLAQMARPAQRAICVGRRRVLTANSRRPDAHRGRAKLVRRRRGADPLEE